MHRISLLLLWACAALLGGCSAPAFYPPEASMAASASGDVAGAPNADAFFEAEESGWDEDGFGFTSFGLATFQDTDGDGLPDTRLPDFDEPEQSARSARKLVREAWLGLFVANVDASIRQMEAYVEGLGGYVAGRDGGSIRYRVPAARFDEATEEVRKLGQVHHETLQVQDVTEQYRDAGIRLDNARKSRERLIALLEKAEKVEDILKIEKELQRLTAEIEAMEGLLKNLDLRVAMSLLQVEFSPLPEAAGPTGPKRPSRFPWIRAVGVDHVLSRR